MFGQAHLAMIAHRAIWHGDRNLWRDHHHLGPRIFGGRALFCSEFFLEFLNLFFQGGHDLVLLRQHILGTHTRNLHQHVTFLQPQVEHK